MNDSKIPVRYAKALFDIALEQDVLDSVYENMRLVLSVCSMKEVKHVLDNPVIPPVKRKEILVSLFPGALEPLTVKFIDLIFDNGRENYIIAASRDFIELTKRHRGITEVTLTTAIPVNDIIRGEIATMIKEGRNGKIEFIERVDSSIIGGFILRIDDSYVDASVKNKLNRFRKEFLLAGNAEE